MWHLKKKEREREGCRGRLVMPIYGFSLFGHISVVVTWDC